MRKSIVGHRGNAMTSRGATTMYEYRILFPRLGSQEIRRQLAVDLRVAGDRRRPAGTYRPERPSRQERA
jgi:hypothetical protein